jgi:hypothetical protein
MLTFFGSHLTQLANTFFESEETNLKKVPSSIVAIEIDSEDRGLSREIVLSSESYIL